MRCFSCAVACYATYSVTAFVLRLSRLSADPFAVRVHCQLSPKCKAEMFFFESLIGDVVVFFVVYKILDRLIRIPRIGNYSARYILVTGCDSGFGHLLAKRLDGLGCHVFAGCLTEKGETELRKVSSERLHSISLDVTKKESVRKAFEHVKSKLPQGVGLWGVVNNAGLVFKSGPNDWMSVEDYKKQCDVNLWGLIDVSLTFLPLVKRSRGRVVNMSSAAGLSSLPSSTLYCLSKFGVEAFTDGLRRDLRIFGCRAILLEPGGFNTPGASKEALRESFVKGWTDAPQEVKEEYGQEYIDYVTKTLCEKIPKTMSNQLDDVIDAYEHALLGRFPRIRYMVGLDVYLFYRPMHALPEWIGDGLWSLLQRTAPTPTVARTK